MPQNRLSIDERFELTEKVRSSNAAQGAGLWVTIDRTDGESYLLWLFQKTGNDVDADVARLLHDTVRRVRGITSRVSARKVLVEVVDVVEDDSEIGLRLFGAQTTLGGMSARSWKKVQDASRTIPGRIAAWRQIERLVRAIGFLHASDLVHGSVGVDTVFLEEFDPLEVKLGGYENCIHLGSISDVPNHALGTSGVASHSQDWRDVGAVAAQLLFQNETDSNPLLPAEQRIFDRLRRPPNLTYIEPEAILAEIQNLCRDLSRIGSSGRQELVAAPSRDFLQTKVPLLTSGTIPPQNLSELLAFVSQDLNVKLPLARESQHGGNRNIELFTDRAVYQISLHRQDSRVARIVDCRPRGLRDRSFDAENLSAQIHIAKDMRSAFERVARTGGGAVSWSKVWEKEEIEENYKDLSQWHALLLIDVAALLEGRLRHFPIEVLDSPEAGIVLVAPRQDAELDEWREKFGRKAAAADLEIELATDDGEGEWTFSITDALTLGPSAPKLAFEGVEDTRGQQAYRFRVEGGIPSGANLLLRPMPDKGLETSVRRRLRHSVSARENQELLSAINDPKSVGLDPALRDMAQPAGAPPELDESKRAAWSAIKAGHTLDLVVGPPGVGKTFLVSHLIASILATSPNARILVSAQNHEALADMERKLREHLDAAKIVVRVEPPPDDQTETRLRSLACELLTQVTETETSPLLSSRKKMVEEALQKQSYARSKLAHEHENLLFDTEHLLLRSASVTLASANSSAVEEMISDGIQFDWV
ncbi:MAG: AAA domain-containing protein, partial [Pseudomonadota bacterium]